MFYLILNQKFIKPIFFSLLIILIPISDSSGQSQDRFSQEKSDVTLRGVRVFLKDRRVEIDGKVNQTDGLIELLATAPGGKEHESALVLFCNPALLKTALYLIGLKDGGGPKYQGDPTQPYGDPVEIYVEWKDNDKLKRCRAEDIVFDKKREGTMPHTNWIFTGSRFVKTFERSKKEIFMANVTGTLIVTYNDPDAIINNPLPEGSDDTVYFANPKLLPPVNTPVKLIILASEKSGSEQSKNLKGPDNDTQKRD